jgi:hypothetical protein
MMMFSPIAPVRQLCEGASLDVEMAFCDVEGERRAAANRA